jgi:hypothetical protein
MESCGQWWRTEGDGGRSEEEMLTIIAAGYGLHYRGRDFRTGDLLFEKRFCSVYRWLADTGPKGLLALRGHTFMVMLVTDEFLWDPEHSSLSDITGEAVGEGYVAGGKELDHARITFRNGIVRLRARTTSWPKVTVAATGAVIYVSTLEAKPLVGYIGFYGPISTIRGDVSLNWSKDGIIVAPLEEVTA